MNTNYPAIKHEVEKLQQSGTLINVKFVMAYAKELPVNLQFEYLPRRLLGFGIPDAAILAPKRRFGVTTRSCECSDSFR